MSWGSEHVVIALWDGLEADRVQVTNKAQAWHVSREFLLKGYAVAFSSALINKMRHGRPA